MYGPELFVITEFDCILLILHLFSHITFVLSSFSISVTSIMDDPLGNASLVSKVLFNYSDDDENCKSSFLIKTTVKDCPLLAL
jgi:hypothetical protein